MYLLPLTKKQIDRRKLLGDEMLDLCRLAWPEIYVDMLRVSLMKPFDTKYYETQFDFIADDLVTMSVFGKLLCDPGRKFDFKTLWDHWLELRNVLAKYLGKEDHGIVSMDFEYRVSNRLTLCRLPNFKFEPRPEKPLPKEWWDAHPNRLATLDRISRNWFEKKKADPFTLEDLNRAVLCRY
jgi:hypothetical protein